MIRAADGKSGPTPQLKHKYRAQLHRHTYLGTYAPPSSLIFALTWNLLQMISQLAYKPMTSTAIRHVEMATSNYWFAAIVFAACMCICRSSDRSIDSLPCLDLLILLAVHNVVPGQAVSS